MTDKKTTSLSALYAQRKSRTQLSNEQRATLHQAIKRQRRRNWFVIECKTGIQVFIKSK